MTKGPVAKRIRENDFEERARSDDAAFARSICSD